MDTLKQKRILLVDVDGTVLDRQKLRQLQEAKSRELFGEQAHKIWDAYDNHKFGRDGRVDVDQLIDTFAKNYHLGNEEELANVFEVFYGVDFAACVDHEGWQALKEAAAENGTDLMFFSQGAESVIPGVKGYQPHKIQRMGLDGDVVGTWVRQDKIKSLPILVQWLKEKGYADVGLVDNEQKKLDKVKELIPEIHTFLAQGREDETGLMAAVREVREWSKPHDLGIEGSSMGGENLA